HWPVHFALLHNDAFWVLDEVQLMGTGLATSLQLEAFRRSFPMGMSSRSLWVSATIDRQRLDTIDFRPHLPQLVSQALNQEDRNHERVVSLIHARKRLLRASTVWTGVEKEYVNALSEEVIKTHQAATNTLVILNQVERAQSLYENVKKRAGNIPVLLIHGRFRPAERKQVEEKLRKKPPETGSIWIATQAVEAGVDMTSATLFTELAPWSSLVQRFGRCNRYAENQQGNVFWLDMQGKDELALPYEMADLQRARELLTTLNDVGPAALPPLPPANQRGETVLRRQDLLDLFNTDPDLTGFDVDISPYIRDVEQPGVMVFWRSFDEQPDDQQPAPQRLELCPVSLGQLGRYLKKKERQAWSWNFLAGEWQKVSSSLRPGMVILLAAKEGGYDSQLGFAPDILTPVTVMEPQERKPEDGFGSDPRSYMSEFVPLVDHLDRTVAAMAGLLKAFSLTPLDQQSLMLASRWHDGGKGHPVMQNTFTHCLEEGDPRKNQLWGKSSCGGKHQRPHFRHEVASMLLWLAHGGKKVAEVADLVAYMILAHHGKVRMSLRALPGEQEPFPPAGAFARGVWQGDQLPEIFLGDSTTIPPTTLSLAIMALGEGQDGPSWTARCQRLLQNHGPFRLAWLETLVRVADWRGSSQETTLFHGEQP
ncbi:MAG: CRISPR-associated helicase Cas3', partial [Magnetococcales bacterium]|nr:CRISPR-associated helicase Cas3' [Magnetococcales bacterium]